MKNKVPNPKCPFDGKDCERFGNCFTDWFWNGKFESLDRCPRLKLRKNLDKKKRVERVALNKESMFQKKEEVTVAGGWA